MSMMFVPEEEKSLDSARMGDTDITEGEPVIREGDTIRPVDPANDTRYDAVVIRHRTDHYLTEHDEEFIPYGEFYVIPSSFSRRVRIQPVGSLTTLRQWTVEDTSATEPSLSKNDVAGYVDLGNGPRIVEEGYTTGGTTYGRESAGDFVVAGRVDHDINPYDSRGQYQRRVELRREDDLF